MWALGVYIGERDSSVAQRMPGPRGMVGRKPVFFRGRGRLVGDGRCYGICSRQIACVERSGGDLLEKRGEADEVGEMMQMVRVSAMSKGEKVTRVSIAPGPCPCSCTVPCPCCPAVGTVGPIH